MKKSKIRTLLCLCATLICMLSLSVSAFASDGGGYYASDESGNATPPDAIESLTISTEAVDVEKDGSNAAFEIDPDAIDISDLFGGFLSMFGEDALTPSGNLTLIDDIMQKESTSDAEDEVHSKQFITVQSKNGNYFYLVIDRCGETENVYFLNLVDEADLMALMEDGDTAAVPTVTCTCKDKCAAGDVDTTCPVCSTNMTECTGKEPAKTLTDKEADLDADNEQQTDEPAEKQSNPGAVLVVVLILAVGGGAAYYFLKVKKNKPQTKGSTDLDEYDFGEDEMEFEQYDSDEEQPDEPTDDTEE